jgi:uncharacterized protein
MHNFFRKLGTLIKNRRLLIIIVGLVLIAASLVSALRLTTAFGTSTFVDTNSQVFKDYDQFTQHFSSDVVVVLVSGDNLSQLLQPENMSAMETVSQQMSALPGVISVIDPTFFIRQAMAQQTGTASLPQDEPTLLAMLLDPQNGQIRTQFKSVARPGPCLKGRPSEGRPFC